MVKKTVNKVQSVFLSALLIILTLVPGMSVFAIGESITITDESGNEIGSRIEVQEYRTVQLGYKLSDNIPEGSTVVWESNLPLLADVDETGKVTGYDYSKAAIIQLWLDEQVRPLPLIGESLAKSIEKAIQDSGMDPETMNTDVLVGIVRALAGDTIADSLKNYLDNMNVEVTATVYNAEGKKLCKDKIEVLVTQSVIASVAPTGVHITNRKKVPLKVAVGATVQLYGAVSPVRLKQGVKWSIDNGISLGASKVATVSDTGLVTFIGTGKATVKVQPSSALYAAFSDKITFEVVDPADLPVKSFEIAGTTSVSEGDTTQLVVANVDPAGAYTGDVVWSSADPTIAVVDSNGIVMGLDGGTISKSVDITATIGEASTTVSVTVKRAGITGSLSGIEISGDTVIPNDKPAQYTSTVFPSRLNNNKSVVREWGLLDAATNKTVWATASAPAEISTATIDNNGLLTPKSSGVITVIAKATFNGASVETSINVLSGKAVTDFQITGKSSVTENSTTQLSIANVLPEDHDEALLSTVEWSSADPSIASVDENGVVKGLDAGGYGPANSAKTTIYATVSGVTRSFEITVKGALINYVTSARIEGNDYVIKDFPVQYKGHFTPKRLDITKVLWGLPTDEGAAPWSASNTLNSSGNMENAVASVSSDGLVTGKTAGETTLHLFGRRNYTSHNETTKKITVVEVEPKSITVTAPTKTEYIEGESELDLTNLKVELTYDRADLEAYYGDSLAALSDEQLRVEVSDYTVSEINQKILDDEQYIVVSVVRAGKTYRGVFSITLKSKELTDIEITNPQYKYVEGVTELDLSGLTVKANYANAESEFVTDYTVDTSAFNPKLFNEEQQITVTYTHAGRSASKTFPVIVYGIPVLSVDNGGYDGNWTADRVVFNFDSTNKLNGVKYYFKRENATDWTVLYSNYYVVNTNGDDVYYFKAVNSEGVESEISQGYRVKFDDVKPKFTLEQSVTALTNQSYTVNIKNITVGESGIKSITLNGEDITGQTEFTVAENGAYTVEITANNGLSSTQTLNVNNIDKSAPVVNAITLEHKEKGGIARLLNALTFGKFFNEQVEITISSEDIGVAGIDRVEYRLLDENGEPISDKWSVYSESGKPVVDPNFKGYVQARAFDKAGNVSDYYRSDGFVIDADVPTDVTVSASFNGEAYTDGKWVSDSVEITLNSSAYSGIYEYLYRVDGGEWVSSKDGKLTASEQGIHTYEFKAVSNSDLESKITTFTVKIDRQVPIIRVDFKGTFGRWTSDEVVFDLSTLYESISGITYYYNDGSGEWTEITTGEVISLRENTNANYSFMAVNGAGTQSPPSDAYYVMIDTVTPEIELVKGETTSPNSPITVSVNANTGASGIKKITVNGADITNEKAFTVTENGTYRVMVFAQNGLYSEKEITITDFDSSAPKIENVSVKQQDGNSVVRPISSTEFAVFMNNTAEITVNASDAETGIASISYRLVNSDGTVKSDWTAYDENAKPVIDTAFKGTVEVKATDNAGNVSEIYKSSTFTVDTVKPEKVVAAAASGEEAYNGGYTNKPVKISLSSSAFSGIYSYEYRIDNGEWAILKSNTVTALEGVHTYEFKAVSYSGLESETTSLTVKIDTAKPILSVAVSGKLNPTVNKNVTFMLGATNSDSGVTYYYNDGTGFKALDGNILTVELTSVKTYTFKAVNGAGNESDISDEYVITVDKTDLSNTIEKANSLDMADVTDITSADLTKAITSGNTVLENNGATVTEIFDAILELENAMDKLEYNKLLVNDNASLLVDRNTNTQYTYMVGLNPASNTVLEVEAQLRNKNVQIEITRDGKKLSETDKVGTGCVIKCISAIDPSIVYEVATVILYGDVNGDGLVDETDKSLIFDDAFFGTDNINPDSIYYIAADVSKDGVLDMFDYFYLDGIASGNRAFDQTQTLYK